MFDKKKQMGNNNGLRGRILKFFDIFENVFLLLFAIGLYILTKELTWAKAVLWTGIVGLTFIYLIKSLDGPKDNILDYIIYKFMWIGYILALFGIFSKLQFLEKSFLLLIIALGTMIIGFIGALIEKFIQKKYLEKKDFIRSVIYVIITLLFAIL